MKRNVILIFFAITLVLMVGAVAFAWWVRQPSTLPDIGGVDGACAQYGISFDDSSIQAQFNEPHQILLDPKMFWREDRAHSLVATSPNLNSGSLPPEDWLEAMQALAQLAQEDRWGEKDYGAATMIMDHRENYCAVGVPVVQSLLPPDAGLGTTIHLTAFTNPAAFTANNYIVMNVDVSHNFGKSAYFFNTLNHELFHIGYWRYQPYQREVWPQSYSLKSALVILQNEGMATYSQELSNASYPAQLEVDFQLSRRPIVLRLFIKRVNNLLQDAATLPEDDVIRELYSGLNQRALYAVGAYMARTIDQELGREALAETVAHGPRSFVKAYNQLVDESWKITEISESPSLNPFQKLRKAAVESMYDQVPDLVRDIQSAAEENLNGATFEEIRSAGWVLQGRGELELVVEVFEVMATLFADHPYSHIYLAEAYLLIGNSALAEESFQQAIAIDPTLIALIR